VHFGRRIKLISLAVVNLVLLAAPAHASGGETPSLVQDIGIALFLSGALALLFTRIRIPALAGFIIAGIIAGPLGLGWVTDPLNIDTIAQLGFVLLLFMIGLEIDLSKIASAGKTIIITGIAQFPLTILFGFLVAKLAVFLGLGAGLITDNLTALYLGAIIAGSSTLLVIKLFQDAFELDTTPGRIALGMLIFQDIWATVIIVLQPQLGDPKIGPILGSFAGIFILGGLAVLVSRTVLPIVFGWVAKVPEVILMGAIGWCFAVVIAGGSLDILANLVVDANLHLTVGSGMGALIAGATIASLPYSTEIITKVGVVKDFFVTLFFVGLGLGIPQPTGPEVLILALVIAIAAIVARQIIFFPLLYWTGTDQRNSEVSSIRLAQISEFGLVIAFLGLQFNHISQEFAAVVVFAFILTALITTPLYKTAYVIHGALMPVLTALGFKEPEVRDIAEGTQWRLALLGFHRTASSLLYNIAANDKPLVAQTVVVDFNVSLHDKIRALGAHVEYGDLSNSDTLQHAGIGNAHVVVATVPDDLLRGIDNRRLVETVRRINPNGIIIANAIAYQDIAAIYAAGADYVFLARLDTARSLEAAIGEALNGELPAYRAMREDEDGSAEDRRGEVLR
jgi:Kef-type K+ transport system membrane component KefB